MPLTGPVTLVDADWTCACGAKAASIEVYSYADPRPVTMPGVLLEVCTCPKCILCGWALDEDRRCDNLDCTLVGVHIVEPD